MYFQQRLIRYSEFGPLSSKVHLLILQNELLYVILYICNPTQMVR
uniref:Uncharacterized protein n=2 Tax=Viruses TaxID=10239 RepID=A0A8S5NLD4_9CAUD|nr:MAG TPA: hypothetical protein [Podoviridae sp. ctsNK10]DAE29366.1 MAG TPA: hypothetical protein [virus sp. ctx9V1]DAJ73264.1 MAG TPA: hypothetical protein [Caudoviricetes sp.]